MKIRIIFAVLAVLSIAFGMSQGHATAETNSYIVQGDSVESTSAAVRSVGGEVTDKLNIIQAVGAKLSVRQADQLRASYKHITLFRDEQRPHGTG